MFNFFKKKRIPFRDPKDFDDLMIRLDIVIDLLGGPNAVSKEYVEGSVRVLKKIKNTLSEFGPKKSRTYQEWLSTYLRNVKSHPVK